MIAIFWLFRSLKKYSDNEDAMALFHGVMKIHNGE